MRSGGPGIFVAKLNQNGSRFLYSTYLPDTAARTGAVAASPAIAVDQAGDSYITGQTTSGHVFVAKLSPDGSVLRYRTIIQGSGTDTGVSIAVDTSGAAYVTGMTSSPDFPVSATAFQRRLAGQSNAFVVKLDPSGNIAFATYLGGSGSDQGVVIQVDAGGSAYVAGTTTSLNFPATPGAYQPKALVPMWGTSPGGFAARLSPNGEGLIYSTYIYGGSALGDAAVQRMILDSFGGSYVAGVSGAGVPVTFTAPQPCWTSDRSVFVTHLDSQGALLDRTYFGAYADEPSGLALAGDHSVWLGLISESSLAKLNFGDPGTPAAACVSPAVLNAATFFPASALSPGEVISIAGFGIGPDQGMSYQPGPAGAAPAELGGVQVFFDSKPAPLLYVQSQQINALAPFELVPYTATNVRVEYNGATVGTFIETVGLSTGALSFDVDPAVFRLAPGFSTQAAAINQDGTVNGPAYPAPVGSVISLFGTGFGQTQRPGVTGSPFPDKASSLVNPVMVEFGNAPGTPGDVLYAGAAPLELSGVDQINVRVPAPNGGVGDAVPIRIICLANGVSVRGLIGTTVTVK